MTAARGGKAVTSLLDPPILGVIGLLIGSRLRAGRHQFRIAMTLTGLFILASVLLYLDVFPFWFGWWISGSEWMLNSGLGTDLSRTGGTDVLTAVILAPYPMWTWAGLSLGRRLGRS